MKELLILLLLVSWFTPTAGQNISLNGDWNFKTDPLNQGIREKWYLTQQGFENWDKMEVPGCWDTHIAYNNYTGIAWYQTTFTAPKYNSKKDLILRFEAIYSDAKIYLNGKLIGSHDFGFTAFDIDIDERVKYGSKNSLVVRVDNSFKLGATWNWGGIRRSVTLFHPFKERICDVKITTLPDLKSRNADVYVKVKVKNISTNTVQIDIYSPKGERIVQRMLNIGANGEGMAHLNIENYDLWSFDHPNLYTAFISYGKENPVKERFGIRVIEVKNEQFYLNGEIVRLNGANWVPYDPFNGSVLPEKIFRRDIDLMKSCGVNMARLSHLALPKDVLDYLDEKGILIVEEIPLWNRNDMVQKNHPTPLKWLKELIMQRYNHPSIIGWSAGNEIGRLSDNPDIKGYLESAFKLIHQLDSTRLAVYVTHTAAKQYDEPVLLSDMIFFNQYGAHGKRCDEVHRRYPGRPIFFCEYGTKANNEEPNNEIIDYHALMESMRGRNFLVGASVWTFNDYRTNYRDNGTHATGNRPWGVVDVYRTKKRGYKKLQRENSPLEKFTLRVQNDKQMVEIIPRDMLSLPAFTMRGYSVELSYFDSKGNIKFKVNKPLPTLHPGDEAINLMFQHNTDKCYKVVAELISPIGYRIDLSRQDLQMPPVPKFKRIECGQKNMRIWFDKNDCEHYLIYTLNGKQQQTPKTIDQMIEISNLEFARPYSLQLVAVNQQGKVYSKEIIEAETQASEIPPIIRHLSQDKKYIYVGYSGEFTDFCYEIQYGTNPEKLDYQILTTSIGACKIPIIDPNKRYFLRLRKRIHLSKYYI